MKVSDCPKCGGRVVKDMKETYCEECGLVIKEQEIQTGWNTGNDHASSQLGSSIQDAKRGKDKRLQRNQKMNKGEGSVKEGLVTISATVGCLELADSFEKRSKKIYRQAHEKGMISSVDAVACASIYIVCKEQGVRSLTEVADAGHVLKKKLYNAYVDLKNELDIEPKITRPKDYVNRICTDLQVDVRKEAKQKLKDVNASGKDPKGMAGAAVYRACEEEDIDILQQDVAESADVSSVTIGTRKKDFE